MEINKEPNCNRYTIKLNNYEALVFFDWLVKFNEIDKLYDEAEKSLLYEFECLLESILEEPFSNNYAELLNTAKNKILNE